MTVKKAQDRVKMLDKRLRGLEDQTEDLSRQMSQVVDGQKLDSLLDKVSEVRSQAETVRSALDQAKIDLAEEMKMQKASEDQVLRSQMDHIKKDNIRRQKTIDKTFTDLMSQIDDFYDVCREYDHLNKQVEGRPRLLPSVRSYAWIGLLRDHLVTISKDYIYTTRRI